MCNYQLTKKQKFLWKFVEFGSVRLEVVDYQESVSVNSCNSGRNVTEIRML